jgi:hypothetical protein
MSSGGGNQTTTTKTEPYGAAEPYLKDILGEAERLYRSGIGRSYFPGSTVVPFAPQTEEALRLQQEAGLEQAGPSQLFGQAANTFGQFASGSMPSSYSQLTPQADYLSDVRSGITSDVMSNIQSQFGGMGRTGSSPAAQQAAARGVATAYAPIASQQASLERGRELQSLESGLGRQFQAAGALPGLQSAMDQRRMGGIRAVGGVGSAYENLANRQLQDQIARFRFGQEAPFNILRQYAGLISPIGSGFPTSYATGPSQQSGGAGGAFGGAVAGSALPGGFGAPIGALLGYGGYL